MFQGTFHLCPGCTRPGPHKPHGGIDDVPAFCAEIARIHCHSELTYHQREELEQYLICECWLLSEKYRPGGYRKGFGTWAGNTLRKRVTEWDQRIRRPRVKWQFANKTYERKVPVLLSLDSGAVGEAERGISVGGEGDIPSDCWRVIRERIGPSPPSDVTDDSAVEGSAPHRDRRAAA